jgi:hypothetical protein
VICHRLRYHYYVACPQSPHRLGTRGELFAHAAGKKILESPGTPREAAKIMIHLSNKYARSYPAK